MNFPALTVGAFGITIFLAVLTEGMIVTRADVAYLFSKPARLVDEPITYSVAALPLECPLRSGLRRRKPAQRLDRQLAKRFERRCSTASEASCRVLRSPCSSVVELPPYNCGPLATASATRRELAAAQYVTFSSSSGNLTASLTGCLNCISIPIQLNCRRSKPFSYGHHH